MEDFFFESLMDHDGVRAFVVAPKDENLSIDSVNGFYSGLAVIPDQTHSVTVCEIKSEDEDRAEGDALVSFTSGVSIGVRTADCVPILIYAPDVKGIAAIHAGWKGTIGGIADNTINKLMARGADPALMEVAFGPSISVEHYEVDHDFALMFINAGFGEHVRWPDGLSGKPRLDLEGINVERLLKLGVRRENIRRYPGCSFGSKDSEGKPLFPSHRRSGGSPMRMLTCISMEK